MGVQSFSHLESIAQASNKPFRYLSKRKELTYILGSRCKDGVVLVGDRKITMEGGADHDYEEKLFVDIHPMVVGSSGVSGLFEKFRNRIKTYAALQVQQGHPINVDAFITEIENQTLNLNQTYRERIMGQVFDVLIGIKTQDAGAVLQYINPIGFAEPVRRYRAIGHGEPYGSIFMKTIWRPDMTMAEVADLGCFIIKYIERFELDSSVGVDSRPPQNSPQIWFIPDANPPPNATEEEKRMTTYNLHPADRGLLDQLESNALERLDQYEMNIVGGFKEFPVGHGFKGFSRSPPSPSPPPSS